MDLTIFLQSIGIGDLTLLGLVLIILLGVGLQWIANLKKIPGIILLLPAGIIVGSYFCLIKPEEIFGDSFFPLVTLGVGFLLFSGGLELDFKKMSKPDLKVIKRLIPIGILITLVVGAFAIMMLFGLNAKYALLISSLLVVSGPTVVGPILSYARPNERLQSVSLWESIIIDPIGAILSVIVLYVLFVNQSQLSSGVLLNSPIGVIVTNLIMGHVENFNIASLVINDLLITAIIGVIFGILLGILYAYVYIYVDKKGVLRGEFSVLFLWLMVILSVGTGELIFPEAGLFSALTLGIVLANHKTDFYFAKDLNEIIEPLIIGMLFITLASLISVDSLIKYFVPSLMLVLVYIVVRMLVAFISTGNLGFSTKERVFLGFLHPRGIVAAASASLFALKLSSVGIEVPEIVPVVFLTILLTVVIYGLLNPILARALGVFQPAPEGIAIYGDLPGIFSLSSSLNDIGTDVMLYSPNNDEINTRTKEELDKFDRGEARPYHIDHNAILSSSFSGPFARYYEEGRSKMKWLLIISNDLDKYF
jgi:NhaP-type Na+/H+ or K+/H+ antiporter